MTHLFLSDEWLDAVDALRAERPEPPPAAKDLVINLTIVDGPDGEKRLRLDAGQLERHHAEDAPTTLRIPYDIAKALFVEGNPKAAMTAFMSGKIRVEGDMTKLMALQTAGDPSPEEAAFQHKLQFLTA